MYCQHCFLRGLSKINIPAPVVVLSISLVAIWFALSRNTDTSWVAVPSFLTVLHRFLHPASVNVTQNRRKRICLFCRALILIRMTESIHTVILVTSRNQFLSWDSINAAGSVKCFSRELTAMKVNPWNNSSALLMLTRISVPVKFGWWRIFWQPWVRSM